MIISRIEFLHRSRLDQETLQVWIAEQWLIPSSDAPDMEFSDTDLARADLIRELRQDLGVNDESVGVILALLDQVHGLRKALGDTLASVRDHTSPSAD